MRFFFTACWIGCALFGASGLASFVYGFWGAMHFLHTDIRLSIDFDMYLFYGDGLLVCGLLVAMAARITAKSMGR